MAQGTAIGVSGGDQGAIGQGTYGDLGPDLAEDDRIETAARIWDQERDASETVWCG